MTVACYPSSREWTFIIISVGQKHTAVAVELCFEPEKLSSAVARVKLNSAHSGRKVRSDEQAKPIRQQPDLPEALNALRERRPLPGAAE